MTSQTLLLRHIHPSWVQGGRVTSQAFRPTTKDKGKLSAYDHDRMTIEECWQHYTGELGLKSMGICAVSVGECNTLALSVELDPVPHPAHVLVDFTAHPSKSVERKARELRAWAEARGWQFQSA